MFKKKFIIDRSSFAPSPLYKENLDWESFTHYEKPCVIGEYDDEYIRKKSDEKRDIWKYIQAYWITNAKYPFEIINELRSDTIVAALVEDGAFEDRVWYPVALLAEMMWNTKKRTIESVLSQTALMPIVEFA